MVKILNVWFAVSMDIPRRPGTPSSPEAAVRQTWSNQKGVITSPDPLHTGPHFDLNSVSAHSLPNIQITRGNGSIGLSTCPCAVNCNKNCCKSSRAMIGTKPDPYGDETPLLSPVKNSIQRSESPAGSYGSTDSSDQLLSDEEAKVRVSGFQNYCVCILYNPNVYVSRAIVNVRVWGKLKVDLSQNNYNQFLVGVLYPSPPTHTHRRVDTA